MADTGSPQPALPEPVLARQNRLHLSLVWIVPIVALVVGAVLVVRSLLQAGPEITVEFRSGEGIEPGRTEVRYKEVVVGRVKNVSLGPSRDRVLVTASLERSMRSLAVEDTRFWVVRPRVGTAGVSGLGTLLSGPYIAVDAGASDETRYEFLGLDQAPLVLRGEPGRSFVLQADDLGSLDVGSPIYHRHVRVGRVVGYTLAANGRSLDIQVFVESPYENLVTLDTRFWNASGIELQLNASGMQLNTQSLASVIAGGIAFAAPPDAAAAAAADSGHRFRLYDRRQQALAPDDGEPMRVRMVFKQSLRGMVSGAPIDLLGVEFGTVRSVSLQPNASTKGLPVEVLADVYPRRLGAMRERFVAADAANGDRTMLKKLVEQGLRAQVRTGSLLTGSLYIALEFMPKPVPAPFDVAAAVPTLPTVPSALADVQPQLAEIVARMSRVRFDEIGSDLQEALKAASQATASLQSTLASADTTLKQLTPEAKAAMAEMRQALASANQAMASAQATLRSAETNITDAQSPLQRNANQALAELQRAAQALRVLADYLQRHPETILRGKPDEPLPAGAEKR
ncbi:MAG TPA: MlaD family protein, partial [Burkholderiaceae bacterium]|nr:MlaD family protein [Burkholderiaceae bacterium]